MLILAIETSASVCSVALHADGKMLAEHTSDGVLQHAELTGEYVEKILSVYKTFPELIAIATGPGSFTGLRIGLSYVKGLCFGRNIPLIGVSNHQVLAAQLKNTSDNIFSAIDAHRNELYLARHKNNPAFEIIYNKIIARDQLKNEVPEKSQLVCPVSLNPDILGNKVTVTKVPFRASLLANIAETLYKEKGPDNIEELEPMYIRPFAGI